MRSSTCVAIVPISNTKIRIDLAFVCVTLCCVVVMGGHLDLAFDESLKFEEGPCGVFSSWELGFGRWNRHMMIDKIELED